MNANHTRRRPWSGFRSRSLPILALKTAGDETLGPEVIGIDEHKVSENLQYFDAAHRAGMRVISMIGQSEVVRNEFVGQGRLLVSSVSFDPKRVNRHQLSRYQTSALYNLATLCCSEKRLLVPGGPEVVAMFEEAVELTTLQLATASSEMLRAALEDGPGASPAT